MIGLGSQVLEASRERRRRIYREWIASDTPSVERMKAWRDTSFRPAGGDAVNRRSDHGVPATRIESVDLDELARRTGLAVAVVLTIARTAEVRLESRRTGFDWRTFSRARRLHLSNRSLADLLEISARLGASSFAARLIVMHVCRIHGATASDEPTIQGPTRDAPGECVALTSDVLRRSDQGGAMSDRSGLWPDQLDRDADFDRANDDVERSRDEDGPWNDRQRSMADRIGLARGVMYALAIEATLVTVFVAWWLS